MCRRDAGSVRARIAAGASPLQPSTCHTHRLRAGPNQAFIEGDPGRVAADARDWRGVGDPAGFINGCPRAMASSPCGPWPRCWRSDLWTDGRPHCIPPGGLALVADTPISSTECALAAPRRYSSVIDFIDCLAQCRAGGSGTEHRGQRLTQASYAQNRDQEDLRVGARSSRRPSSARFTAELIASRAALGAWLPFSPGAHGAAVRLLARRVQAAMARGPYVRERRNDQHSLPVAAPRTISAAVATKKDASAPVSRRSCGAVVESCHSGRPVVQSRVNDQMSPAT